MRWERQHDRDDGAFFAFAGKIAIGVLRPSDIPGKPGWLWMVRDLPGVKRPVGTCATRLEACRSIREHWRRWAALADLQPIGAS